MNGAGSSNDHLHDAAASIGLSQASSPSNTPVSSMRLRLPDGAAIHHVIQTPIPTPSHSPASNITGLRSPSSPGSDKADATEHFEEQNARATGLQYLRGFIGPLATTYGGSFMAGAPSVSDANHPTRGRRYTSKAPEPKDQTKRFRRTGKQNEYLNIFFLS